MRVGVIMVVGIVRVVMRMGMIVRKAVRLLLAGLIFQNARPRRLPTPLREGLEEGIRSDYLGDPHPSPAGGRERASLHRR